MVERYVELYVYDISKGLAKSLSPMFLGRQIDGIWHTGVVVDGQEYFFGGMGVDSCSPGCTMLGQPTNVVQLGSTKRSPEDVKSHLQHLSQSSFRPERYHLFDYNCNTFSDELAQFLTGNKIPSYITSLPQEVLQTPFGAMIKSMTDSVQVSPSGGHTLLFSSQAAVPQQVERVVMNKELPPIATDSSKSALGQYLDIKSSLLSHLSQNDVSLLDETYEYVTPTVSNDWSLRPLHVKLLCQLIANSVLSADVRITVSNILQLALLSDDFIAVCGHDPSESFVGLWKNLEELDGRLTIHIARCVCNFVSTKAGAEKFIGITDEATTQFTNIIRFLLLHTDPELQLIGSQLASNVLRTTQAHSAFHPYGVDKSSTSFGWGDGVGMFASVGWQTLSDDLAFELGVILVESCKSADQRSAEYLWFSVCTCIQFNPQLAEFAAAADLDVAEHEKRFPDIIKYTSSVKKYFS